MNAAARTYIIGAGIGVGCQVNNRVNARTEFLANLQVRGVGLNDLVVARIGDATCIPIHQAQIIPVAYKGAKGRPDTPACAGQQYFPSHLLSFLVVIVRSG